MSNEYTTTHKAFLGSALATDETFALENAHDPDKPFEPIKLVRTRDATFFEVMGFLLTCVTAVINVWNVLSNWVLKPERNPDEPFNLTNIIIIYADFILLLLIVFLCSVNLLSYVCTPSEYKQQNYGRLLDALNPSHFSLNTINGASGLRSIGYFSKSFVVNSRDWLSHCHCCVFIVCGLPFILSLYLIGLGGMILSPVAILARIGLLAFVSNGPSTYTLSQWIQVGNFILSIFSLIIKVDPENVLLERAGVEPLNRPWAVVMPSDYLLQDLMISHKIRTEFLFLQIRNNLGAAGVPLSEDWP